MRTGDDEQRLDLALSFDALSLDFTPCLKVV